MSESQTCADESRSNARSASSCRHEPCVDARERCFNRGERRIATRERRIDMREARVGACDLPVCNATDAGALSRRHERRSELLCQVKF